ncbi:MAG: hybrid sensor histidine kinase/response regulator [Bacteroidales bacterium]|nr:hybrid sensor histidine kinase/response regulator [Bacteroidales bacterium]
MSDQEEFLRELLNDFKIEASEHYQSISKGLNALEKDPYSADRQSIIESVFRAVHSMKGASRAVNLLDIEKLCMSLEGVFQKLKKGEMELVHSMFNLLYKTADTLKEMIDEIDRKNKKITPSFLTHIADQLGSINTNTQPEMIQKTEPAISTSDEEIKETDQEKSVEIETVRVATPMLYHILKQAEELIAVKSTISFYVDEIQNLAFSYLKQNHYLLEEENRRSYIDGISSDHKERENVQERNFRKQHEEDLYTLSAKFDQLYDTTSKIIDKLLYDVKTTLLVPFSSLLSIVPKIVRDLSGDYFKEIDLIITGDDVQIDRRILEEIKDPLIHLIRNCIDHGIETKEVREKKGKNPKGTLKIAICQIAGNQIEIVISDDGAGINKQKVLASAIKNGLTTENKASTLTDKKIFSFIFASGVSASPIITDISGRGLGMAIVSEKIKKLGGQIDLETSPSGTCFTITLPQTLATFRGILLKASEQFFIMPSSAFKAVINIMPTDIKTIESQKTIFYRSKPISLIRLSEILGLPLPRSRKDPDQHIPVMIIGKPQKKIAIIVDEVIGEYEGIIKNMGSLLVHVQNITGVTIIGGGKVVPILNASEIIAMTSKHSNFQDFGSIDPENKEKEICRILVADDSITVRSMIRNYLETAGYSVTTAVDGFEAFQFLQNEEFDIVVSDVEMPRMNGFDLTVKIREDTALKDMPVILVTALESAEDRHKGLEAGANAYIVKSNFEKNNLIDTIHRLV